MLPQEARPYYHEACELCGKPFRAWTKRGRYCSNKCSGKDNPKPQNKAKYPITLDLLQKVDEDTDGYISPMKEVADLVGCTPSAVFYAAKRLGYVWRERRNKRDEGYGKTTETEQKYARSIGCVVCGEKRVVDAAHLVPRTEGGIGREPNIIPLCPNHHRLYDRDQLSSEERRKFVAFLFVKYPTIREKLKEEGHEEASRI